ncbi:IncV family inclusion membrane protein [Chlamydia suis]|uniref:IncV family inclusion membrane protein n=1 Tax=Chlamydia suis TaxID=83559 RepID=UPI0009B0397F|nr:IncV family inclusion membrane protein [Chlamydia suis]
MATVTPTSPQQPFQAKGLLSRFLTAPDRHPKLRYVYDISLIAISILCIVSIILWTQGSGLALFAIAPALAIGALGVTLLVSDLAESQKSKDLADTVAAISLPFILTGTAAGLMFSAVAVGGGALILANPMFLMGSMTLGFALMSLHKVTYQYLSNREQWQKQNKIEQIELAAWENQLPKEEEVSSSQESLRNAHGRKKNWHRRRAIRKRVLVPTTLFATTKESSQSQESLHSKSDTESKSCSPTPSSCIQEKTSEAAPLSVTTSENKDSSDDSSTTSVYFSALSDVSDAKTVALGDVSGTTSSNSLKAPSSSRTERRVVRLTRSQRNARHQHNNQEQKEQNQEDSSDEGATSSSSSSKRKKRKHR